MRGSVFWCFSRRWSSDVTCNLGNSSSVQTCDDFTVLSHGAADCFLYDFNCVWGWADPMSLLVRLWWNMSVVSLGCCGGLVGDCPLFAVAQWIRHSSCYCRYHPPVRMKHAVETLEPRLFILYWRSRFSKLGCAHLWLIGVLCFILFQGHYGAQGASEGPVGLADR